MFIHDSVPFCKICYSVPAVHRRLLFKQTKLILSNFLEVLQMVLMGLVIIVLN